MNSIRQKYTVAIFSLASIAYFNVALPNVSISNATPYHATMNYTHRSEGKRYVDPSDPMEYSLLMGSYVPKYIYPKSSERKTISVPANTSIGISPPNMGLTDFEFLIDLADKSTIKAIVDPVASSSYRTKNIAIIPNPDGSKSYRVVSFVQ